jgi:hypothetical protein
MIPIRKVESLNNNVKTRKEGREEIGGANNTKVWRTASQRVDNFRMKVRITSELSCMAQAYPSKGRRSKRVPCQLQRLLAVLL